MLVYEYKLDGAPAQYARMEEAIRVAQFVRNECVRVDRRAWHLGQRPPGLSQPSADRVWVAIQRFYVSCRAKTPGKKGYLRFPPDKRSVEYKGIGWKLDPDGRHLTLTDGCGIGGVWRCRHASCSLVGHRDVVGSVNRHPLAFGRTIPFPAQIT